MLPALSVQGIQEALISDKRYSELWSRRNGPKSASARLLIKIKLYEECEGKCHWCKEPMEYPKIMHPNKSVPKAATFEHVIPYSEGGEFTPGDNIVLAHALCNNQRHKVRPSGWNRIRRWFRQHLGKYAIRKQYWQLRKWVLFNLFGCFPTNYRLNASERKQYSKVRRWRSIKGKELIPLYYLLKPADARGWVSTARARKKAKASHGSMTTSSQPSVAKT
jgi:5-methylcytosine-specific restriction endonuclease McrA